MRRLWLRWSWRDLRARWPQVAAIALIIGIGSGTYSGLSSTSEWRKVSYDDSYDELHMWDLRVSLGGGSLVDAAALADTARSIPHAAAIEHAESRLIGATQVDASTSDETILVPGRLVGVDVADGGPQVASLDAVTGRGLRPSDAGADVGLLDTHFARTYDLPPTGTVKISGDREIRYVGQALAPEYFMVIGDEGSLLAEANFAVLFVPLETAQTALGHPGQANDLVLTLRDPAQRDLVRKELSAALHQQFPDVGFTFMNRRDEKSYRYLYDDIEGDQRFYNIFAVLILAGAAFAAFNLTGRIVQAQRREIGIGMALGAPPRELATRPMLIGLQVSLLGAVFGVAVGLLIAWLMGGVLRDFFPLPAWSFSFEVGVFLRGALLGLLLPFAATLIPVWRAVRVTPVQAIRTGYLSERGSGVAPLLARIPVPGKSTTQLPFRNVLRSPRRTFMTMLGIAVAIMVLIGVLGMVDSFVATIDAADTELTKGGPDRTEVGLDFYYPADAEQVQAIGASEEVAASEANLRLGGELRHGGEKIETLLVLTPFDSQMWRPTIEDRVEVDGPGIVLAEKAAEDLGVSPGETVTLRHPRRTGLTAYELVDTEVPVVGVTPVPARFVSYMDRDPAAGLMNLEGITNVVMVEPAPGVTVDELKRSLFGDPGVSSVQPVSAFGDAIKKQLDRYLDLLTIVEGAVLLLALLIAFNSTSINVDERAREHATMMAFGLPTRTVLRMTIVESVTIGILGTLAGLGLGWLLLDWLIRVLIPETLPDLGIITAIAPSTLVTAVVLGVVAVAVAPLFTLRKMRNMDVPSTLRVME